MVYAHHHNIAGDGDNAIPAGFLYFQPHIPSLIHDAIGGFIGTSKYGAHDFKITKDSMCFLVDAHRTKCNVSQVSISGYYGVLWFTFNIDCFNSYGAHVFSKFCYDKADLLIDYNEI